MTSPAAPTPPAAAWAGAGGLDLEDLLAELRQRASAARHAQERMAGLLEAVVAVSSDLDLAEVLARIVESACSLVGARYGALGVLGTDREHLVEFITRGVSEEERDRIGDLPRGHGILGLLIRDPQPRRMRDIGAHPDSYGFPPNHPPMHSFLGTPIRIRDVVFGNLYMAEKQGVWEFTAEDEEVLIALASAAGVAIDNARLYDSRDRQRRWTEALAELTHTLLEREDEEAAVRLMVARAVELGHGSVAMVALQDASGDLVIRGIGRSAPSPKKGLNDAGAGLVLTGERWSELMQTRQPLLVTAAQGPDPAGDLTAELCRVAGADPRSPSAFIPLAPGSLGILVVLWDPDEVEAPTDTMSELTDYAQQAGLALLAGRAQRDRSRVALLDDRARIARDMHDHVIQRLFATGLSLQAVSRVAMHPLVQTRLEEAVDELDQAVKEIRLAIFELHQPIPQGPPREEIEGLVGSFAQSLGFAPELVVQGRLAGLPPALRSQLLAVVREGLSNVLRHADASQAGIRIVVDTFLSIEVFDDGAGFDPARARGGLVNLRERALTRGGTFEVTPRDPRGTRLRWRVPLPTV